MTSDTLPAHFKVKVKYVLHRWHECYSEIIMKRLVGRVCVIYYSCKDSGIWIEEHSLPRM